MENSSVDFCCRNNKHDFPVVAKQREVEGLTVGHEEERQEDDELIPEILGSSLFKSCRRTPKLNQHDELYKKAELWRVARKHSLQFVLVAL